MRLDSPFVLAVCGTIAVHVLALVAGDALVVYNPRTISIPAPRIELFDVELPPPPPPEKKVEPEVPKELPKDETPPEPVKQVEPKQPKTVETRRATQPVQETPTPPDPTPTPEGGGPVVQMDDLVPTKDGVAVKPGKPNTGKIGGGGKGNGTGGGEGSGAGPPPPPPVSVATIKTRALPKGDYGYIDAGRDYPPEARRLGIEGQIKVRLVVDATGKVQSAVLLNKLGHGLDELALAKAKQIQFEPAKDTDDKAVASVVIWTFNMTLPK